MSSSREARYLDVLRLPGAAPAFGAPHLGPSFFLARGTMGKNGQRPAAAVRPSFARCISMPATLFTRAVVRALASLAAGLLSGAVLLAITLLPHLALLTAISVAAALFVITGLAVLWPMDADRTRDFSNREDFRPIVDETIVLVATLGGLAGILMVLVLGDPATDDASAILALLGAFATWACLHIMYAARYAYIYYRDPSRKVIDFNTDEPPAYQDFFYFSFAVGMTYGVTDTSVSDRQVRVIVLRHSVLSFVFGAAILATAINLVVDAISP